MTTSEKGGDLGVSTKRQKRPIFNPLFYHFFLRFFAILASTRLNSRLNMTHLKSSGGQKIHFWPPYFAFFYFEIQKRPFSSLCAKWKIVIFEFFHFFESHRGYRAGKMTVFFLVIFWLVQKWPSFCQNAIFPFTSPILFFIFFEKVVFFLQKWDFFFIFFTFFGIFCRFSALTTRKTQKWPLKMTPFWPPFWPLFLTPFLTHFLPFWLNF